MTEIDVSQPVLQTIVAGMQAMAMADGTLDPREQALLDAVMMDIDGEPNLDLSVLDTDQSKELFMTMVTSVALADAEIDPSEYALLEEYAQLLAVPNSAMQYIALVAEEMFLQYSLEARQVLVPQLAEKMYLGSDFIAKMTV